MGNCSWSKPLHVTICLIYHKHVLKRHLSYNNEKNMYFKVFIFAHDSSTKTNETIKFKLNINFVFAVTTILEFKEIYIFSLASRNVHF